MTANQVVGYTGVTASGAGFSGSATVVRSSRSPGGPSYDDVIDDAPVIGSAPLGDSPVVQQIVFTEDEVEPIVAGTGSEVSKYAYEWDIGPSSPLVTAEGAMSVMKDSPNVVFPFEVAGLKGERTIELGHSYNLNNVRTPGDDQNPVEVVAADSTSFTFLTLDGHFRGPGRTIRFVTLVRDNRLILRQEGVSSASKLDQLYDVGARISWQYQADNLRAAIYGGERSDFPGTLPIFW